MATTVRAREREWVPLMLPLTVVLWLGAVLASVYVPSRHAFWLWVPFAAAVSATYSLALTQLGYSIDERGIECRMFGWRLWRVPWDDYAGWHWHPWSGDDGFPLRRKRVSMEQALVLYTTSGRRHVLRLSGWLLPAAVAREDRLFELEERGADAAELEAVPVYSSTEVWQPEAPAIEFLEALWEYHREGDTDWSMTVGFTEREAGPATTPAAHSQD